MISRLCHRNFFIELGERGAVSRLLSSCSGSSGQLDPKESRLSILRQCGLLMSKVLSVRLLEGGEGV